jgi:hypothetical protein
MRPGYSRERLRHLGERLKRSPKWRDPWHRPEMRERWLRWAFPFDPQYNGQFIGSAQYAEE